MQANMSGINFIMLTGCLFFIFACKQSTFLESRVTHMLEVFEQNSGTFDQNVYSILVIPQTGCGGCIGEATHWLVNSNPTLLNSMVVFTAIDNVKELKIVLGQPNFKDRILIDSLNLFYDFSSNNSIYPRILVREGNGNWHEKVFNLSDSILFSPN
jgi:hypothetical protein